MDTPPQAQPEHVAQRQYRLYNVTTSMAMVLSSFGAGYAASIIGSTLAQPSFIYSFKLADNPNATQLIATTNGLFFVGGILGTATIAWIADHWGRLWAAGMSSLAILVSSACLAGSVNIGMFITFRSIHGAGVFMVLAAVPMWISETAAPATRGIFANVHSVGILMGYSLAGYLGYAFYHLAPMTETNDMAWRSPYIIGCAPVFLHIILLPFLPESPRWLILQGKTEQAEKTLRRLHTSEEAAIEMVQITNAIEVDKRLDGSWRAMVRNPAYRKRALISASVVFFLQSSGTLTINNYGPTIYGSLGFDLNTQLIYQFLFNTSELVGGILSFIIVDRFPRPKLLAGGIFVCCSALIVLAAILANFATTPESLAHPNRTALRAAVGMIYIYGFSFDFFMDGPMFAYMAELFPTHIRAKGLVITICALCLINILWTQVAPTAFATIGWKFYLCFIIPSTLWAIVCWFTFPDTLGVPLEEIARMFGDHEDLYMMQHEMQGVGGLGETKGENDRELPEVSLEETVKHA